jgi:leucine dehydrogenase
MSLFQTPDFDQHELVAYCIEKEFGLKAIIAIHNTRRGPALGGCRIWHYRDEDEATRDALRLSRGMTYKAALANLNLGGGKAVILADSQTLKTPELLQAFGRFVERFNGQYITAEDVGTSPEDMSEIRKTTQHVVGLKSNGGSGDPAVMTAYGVYQGMKGSAFFKYGTDSLKGLTIAIQGLGHVGMLLVEKLHQEGAFLIVTDIDQNTVKKVVDKFGAIAVNPEDIFQVDCDIFSPCALGGILNDETIPQFRCQIIAGSANNQLLTPQHGDRLKERGILYAPDYLINAGGLINVTYEGPNYDRQKAITHVEGIRDTLLEILTIAKEHGISTNTASDQIAENRFKHP